MNDFKDRPVEVITSRVEPELALFQVQIEGGSSHPTEPGKPGFGKTPEPLDAVDVGLPFRELVPAVVDSQVLAIADIDQSVVAAPVVGVEHALGFHFASYNRLQCGFGAVGALEDAEDGRLAEAPRSRFPLTWRAPKNDSSTSTSPMKGDCCSECSANRSLIAFRKRFTVLRFRLGNSATWVASKSSAKSFTSSRNLASEIFERMA